MTDSVSKSVARSSDTRWGPTVNGLQVGMRLENSVVSQPNPVIELVCSVRNVSDKPLRLIDLATRAGYWQGAPPLRATCDGNPVNIRRPPTSDPPDHIALAELAPGQTWSTPTHLDLANISVPTGRSVELTLYIQGGSPEMAAEQSGLKSGRWFGEAHSGPVNVRYP